MIPKSKYSKILLASIVAQAIIIIALEYKVSALIESVRGNATKAIGVYTSIYILAHLFQIILCWEALLAENTMQIVTMCIFCLGTTGYGVFQGYQIASLQPVNEHLRFYLMAIPILSSVFLIISGVIVGKVVNEFGWTMFKRLGADPKMRKLYQTYEMFLLSAKLSVFFILGFGIQSVVLVISQSDMEYWATIGVVPLLIILLGLSIYAVMLFLYRCERKVPNLSSCLHLACWQGSLTLYSN